jgi:hypothetical protein
LILFPFINIFFYKQTFSHGKNLVFLGRCAKFTDPHFPWAKYIAFGKK